MVPLHWGLANNAITPQTSLAAGATGSITQNTPIYAGTGRMLLVSVDFADASGAGAQSAKSYGGQTTRESLDECIHEARTHRHSVQDTTMSRARAAALAASATRPGESTTD
jgi:hypothetical protein